MCGTGRDSRERGCRSGEAAGRGGCARCCGAARHCCGRREAVRAVRAALQLKSWAGCCCRLALPQAGLAAAAVWHCRLGRLAAYRFSQHPAGLAPPRPTPPAAQGLGLPPDHPRPLHRAHPRGARRPARRLQLCVRSHGRAAGRGGAGGGGGGAAGGPAGRAAAGRRQQGGQAGGGVPARGHCRPQLGQAVPQGRGRGQQVSRRAGGRETEAGARARLGRWALLTTAWPPLLRGLGSERLARQGARRVARAPTHVFILSAFHSSAPRALPNNISFAALPLVGFDVPAAAVPIVLCCSARGLYTALSPMHCPRNQTRTTYECMQHPGPRTEQDRQPVTHAHGRLCRTLRSPPAQRCKLAFPPRLPRLA